MDLKLIVLVVSVLFSHLVVAAPQDIGLEPNSTNGIALLDQPGPGVIGGHGYYVSWTFLADVPIPGLPFCMAVILALCDLALADYNEKIALPMEFRYPEYNGLSITVVDTKYFTTTERKYAVIALFYLLKGAAGRNVFTAGTLELRLKNRVVAILQVKKRKDIPPAVSLDSSTPAAQQLSSSNTTAIVDIEHYNSSFMLDTPNDDSDLAQEPSNAPFRLYYNFYGSSFRIDQYLITLAFGLARLAERDAGAVLTEVDETLEGTQNHLLLTPWAQPPRKQPPYFLNRLAIRGLCNLAKLSVRERKFQEVEAVIEVGAQTPVGVMNVTRIPRGCSEWAKGVGKYVSCEQVKILE